MTQNKKQAIACILSAAFFFGLMNLFVKLSGDLPIWQKSLFRNLVAFAIAAIVILRNRQSILIDRSNVSFMFLRCFVGTLGILCNYYAVSTLNIADASMLNKLSPFFAIIFSIFILREKPAKADWAAIVLAFVGALFVIKPTFTMSSFPAVIGVLGGLTAGLAYTCVRKLGTRGVKGSVIVFWFSSFSCLFVLPGVIMTYKAMTLTQLLCLMAAGASAAIAQFSITAAYSKAPAKEISVFDYTQVIFSALMSFLILSDLPDILSVIGYVIIIGTAFWKWRRNMAS